jgi:hypothetical protein
VKWAWLLLAVAVVSDVTASRVLKGAPDHRTLFVLVQCSRYEDVSKAYAVLSSQW